MLLRLAATCWAPAVLTPTASTAPSGTPDAPSTAPSGTPDTPSTAAAHETEARDGSGVLHPYPDAQGLASGVVQARMTQVTQARLIAPPRVDAPQEWAEGVLSLLVASCPCEGLAPAVHPPCTAACRMLPHPCPRGGNTGPALQEAGGQSVLQLVGAAGPAAAEWVRTCLSVNARAVGPTSHLYSFASDSSASLLTMCGLAATVDQKPPTAHAITSLHALASLLPMLSTSTQVRKCVWAHDHPAKIYIITIRRQAEP